MSEEKEKPRKWWQWLLIYPVLATAMIAAIPTYLEIYGSRKYGVDYGQSTKAVEQRDLWEKNMDCTLAPYEWLVTSSNVKVDATICQSGDVLVRVHLPTEEKFYEWVPVNRFLSRQASIGLINNAIANGLINDTVIAQGITVICQRWIDQYRIIRRISIPGRGCFDEIVNTYTGVVESSRSVPCNAVC